MYQNREFKDLYNYYLIAKNFLSDEDKSKIEKSEGFLIGKAIVKLNGYEVNMDKRETPVQGETQRIWAEKGIKALQRFESKCKKT